MTATPAAEAPPLHYSDAYIRGILEDTKVIAMVGASANWKRPSYFAMKYLQKKGYRVIPVNPGHAGGEILGETVYADLESIPEKVDMVDCFRASEAIPPIAESAVKIGAEVLWMQLGVRNDEAAALAEAAGLKVVMDRCPKIEYGRLNRELGWSGVNTGVISSKRGATRKFKKLM
jgi:predicted CoA-binding protein